MTENWDDKEELKKRLTAQQYAVTQNAATDKAFSGEYVKVDGQGLFSCVVCSSLLFKTENKYDSGSGWPSFNDVASQGAVKCVTDTDHGMVRTEVMCSKCDAHLGHVFDDGPSPKGQRYCINSSSMCYKKDNDC